MKDYRQYKFDKSCLNEQLTTPLHLACQQSNIEAVRILIENHGYDVNILLNDRNFLVELLQNSGYSDFSILNMILKKRRPCINSGTKLALNQAILRGNPFMIKTMMEFGKPNPFVRDSMGKAPIHIAAAKLDQETFEALVRSGANPMMPDADGNTFLHIMAMGVIKDVEYDFIKQAVVRHKLRLSRNKEGRTALNIIKAYSAQGAVLRGQPNFKRKLWEFFENRIADVPTFIDAQEDLPVHKAVLSGELNHLRALIHQLDQMSGKETKEVMDLLETRNHLGKTPFYLAVEHNQKEIANFLLDNYPNINYGVTDTYEGNTTLHVAVQMGLFELVKRIFEIKKERCLATNHKGQTPLFLAVQNQSMEILELFEDFKYEALTKIDYLGENPLFECARNGNEKIFNWFMGSNEFYQARGQQNYKGQTIEHIVCMHKQIDIVDEIHPRPDTVDYYGNLPLYYCLKQDHHEMLVKHFTKGRDYFLLRNYKFETVFHICAKANALESLKILVGRAVFI